MCVCVCTRNPISPLFPSPQLPTKKIETNSEDLNSAKERSAVHLFATGAIKRLQEKDRKLPQVKKYIFV